jgi:hypothetical protein
LRVTEITTNFMQTSSKPVTSTVEIQIVLSTIALKTHKKKSFPDLLVYVFNSFQYGNRLNWKKSNYGNTDFKENAFNCFIYKHWRKKVLRHTRSQY